MNLPPELLHALVGLVSAVAGVIAAVGTAVALYVRKAAKELGRRNQTLDALAVHAEQTSVTVGRVRQDNNWAHDKLRQLDSRILKLEVEVAKGRET